MRSNEAAEIASSRSKARSKSNTIMYPFACEYLERASGTEHSSNVFTRRLDTVETHTHSIDRLQAVSSWLLRSVKLRYVGGYDVHLKVVTTYM